MASFTPRVLRTALFPALVTIWKLLLPFIGEYIPIAREVVHWHEGVQYDPSTQYPIIDFVGLVEENGYDAEEYKVTTSDGYIIRIHRISGGPNSPTAPGKPVVLIQHGILLASDNWVLIGPHNDLPYLLADAGYDVWVGNIRGNSYSREHVSLNPDSDEYWEFSFHEMGIYDIPAIIDTILDTTGVEKLNYIGYSMGTTMSYIMLSMLPEYNDKIETLYSFAPVAFWNYDIRRLIAFVELFAGPLKVAGEFFDVNNVLPQSAVAAYVGSNYCNKKNVTQPLCVNLFCLIALDCDRFNKTALPSILAHFPAGISRQSLLHYDQHINNKTFKAYDYGARKNRAKYGQSEPPHYNISKITVPVRLIYGESDDIANPKDVIDLGAALPNLVSIYKIKNKKFNHFDFLYATDVRQLVYEQLPLLN